MKRVTSIFSVLLLYSTFDKGNCDIRCYSCSTQDDPSQCLHPANSAIELRKCDVDALKHMKKLVENAEPLLGTTFEVLPPRNIPYTCMKQVVKVGTKEYVIRGCQLTSANEDLDICSVLKKKQIRGTNVTHCSLCNWDGCNSSRGLHYYSILNIVLPVALLITYSYQH